MAGSKARAWEIRLLTSPCGKLPRSERQMNGYTWVINRLLATIMVVPSSFDIFIAIVKWKALAKATKAYDHRWRTQALAKAARVICVPTGVGAQQLLQYVMPQLLELLYCLLRVASRHTPCGIMARRLCNCSCDGIASAYGNPLVQKEV